LVGAVPSEVSDLHRAIEADGGGVLTVWREPYAGKLLMVAALPIELIGPTPYHRNLSDARVHKLGAVVGKPGRFLDPIICARRPQLESGVKFWTTNGHHRLAAMRKLGAKSITALVIPETAAAYQILALITEKAHNLREKALEVIRMYTELERVDHVSEEHDVLEFEEPALTRSGSVTKRLEQFLAQLLHQAMGVQKERARVVLALDDLVGKLVERLKARGLERRHLKVSWWRGAIRCEAG
jgi:ParB family chromosome partitioning protein